MKSETLDKLQSIMDTAVKNQELVGGSLLVIQGGKEVCYLETGVADKEQGRPIKRNDIYRLYSMTKPITSAAVMKLMEDGVIDLAQPVSDFIPTFADQQVDQDGKLVPCNRPVMIKDLLSMTAGLVYECGEGLSGAYAEQVFKEMFDRLLGERPMTTVELATAIGKGPLAYQPGEGWRYSTAADVLGAIVEIVSGMTFGQYLEKNFFEPLGMKDTGFFVPEEKRDRLIPVYEADAQGNLIPYHGNHLGVINTMDRQPAFESGGAGLVSTVDDYAKFARMLLQKGELNGVRVLQPETVCFMTTGTLSTKVEERFVNRFPKLSGFHYGNLMRVMKEPGRAHMLGHVGEYGWDGWLGCHFCNDLETDTTILFMMQKTKSGTTTLVRKLRNVIFSQKSALQTKGKSI